MDNILENGTVEETTDYGIGDSLGYTDNDRFESSVNGVGAENAGEFEDVDNDTELIGGAEEENDTPFKSFATEREYQSEINRLTAERMNSDENEYFRRAGQYNGVIDKLKTMFGVDNEEEALRMVEEQYYDTIAQSRGIDRESAKQIYELEQKAAELDNIKRTQEIYQQSRARINDTMRQAMEFKKKNPDFDMNTEIHNEQFKNYIIKNNMTVEDAYYLTHRAEMEQKAMDSVVSNINARNSRITENGAGNVHPAQARINPNNLKDSDIDNILQRVANGERIEL